MMLLVWCAARTLNYSVQCLSRLGGGGSGSKFLPINFNTSFQFVFHKMFRRSLYALSQLKCVQMLFEIYQSDLSTHTYRRNTYVLLMQQIERGRLIHAFCFTVLIETCMFNKVFTIL